MAHLDTVPLCVGAKPVLKGGMVRSGDKTTGLGADDRSGCAVVLTAAREILSPQAAAPAPGLLLAGAGRGGLVRLALRRSEAARQAGAGLQLGRRGRPKSDRRGPGGFRISIGVSAWRAMPAWRRNSASAPLMPGWQSPICDAQGWLATATQWQTSTSNIGVIRGGAATNVVTARSNSRPKRAATIAAFAARSAGYRQAFSRRPNYVPNAAGVVRRSQVFQPAGLRSL